eukprot:2991996-Lingulodinium_polyedra.AAC.1
MPLKPLMPLMPLMPFMLKALPAFGSGPAAPCHVHRGVSWSPCRARLWGLRGRGAFTSRLTVFIPPWSP